MPAGFAVPEYAGRFDNPRWLYVAPNGDVLVGESATIPTTIKRKVAADLKLDPSKSLKPTSANRITLLRETDNDGRPEIRTALLDSLNQPLGMLAQLVRAIWPIAREQLRRIIEDQGGPFSLLLVYFFPFVLNPNSNEDQPLQCLHYPFECSLTGLFEEAGAAADAAGHPHLDDLRRVGHALIP